jgi:hypothetical protein
MYSTPRRIRTHSSNLDTRIPRPMCRHWRQPVEIFPGVRVHASAYCDRPRTDELVWPQVGVYLSDAWAGEAGLASYYWAGPVIGPRTEVAILPWPDGGIPLYPEETRKVLAYALRAAQAGRFVEIGCHVGTGAPAPRLPLSWSCPVGTYMALFHGCATSTAPRRSRHGPRSVTCSASRPKRDRS